MLFSLASLAVLLSLQAVAGPGGAGKDPATRALSIFSDVLSLTRTNYVETAEAGALLEGAYDGMTDALDAFSYYIPASSLAAYRSHQSSDAVGPGILIARRGGFPYVVGPLPNSPAERVGVEPGDLLDTVDGKSVRNAPIWRIRSALEGPEGSSVEIGLFRSGEEGLLRLRVARARIPPAPLQVRFERDVAIIRIPSFASSTGEALRRELEQANRRSISRLVVDLRGSLGGEIADAVPAASLFVGQGLVARLLSRRLEARSLEAAGERFWKGRTVILTDDATGGPAEVFAAALHDRAEATTVGEATAGMAIVQRLVPTGSGGSLFMTVGRYVSPGGQTLVGKGLSPDERVIFFPDGEKKDAILERGLEIVRRGVPLRRAA